MRKSIIKALLCLVFLVALPISGTLAYLTAAGDPVTNTFALAQVDTEINEGTNWDASGKSPVIENHGLSSVYIRARAVVSGGDAAVNPQDITFNYNTAGGWFSGSDGFYYYNQILPGTTSITVGNRPATKPLFNGVTVSDKVDPKATFTVTVYHESVLAPASPTPWTLANAIAAFTAKT